MGDWKIPLSDVSLGEQEINAVVEVLQSGWLTAGNKTASLEKEFSILCNTPHAIAVSNCTMALELSLRALDIGPGDEVIVPSLTFVATANAVSSVGATPVFADIISEKDLTICPKDVSEKINHNTRAVIAVHYGGYPAKVEQLRGLCQENKLWFLEDCAHAPGGTFQGKPLGSFGIAGCFSFFGNKNITTGEGGMIVTHSEKVATSLRLLRSHGMTSTSWDRYRGHASSYDVIQIGHNARFDDIRASLGLIQLSRLPDFYQRRKTLVQQYRNLLSDFSVPFKDCHESTFHIMVVLLPVNMERNKVINRFREHQIQTSVHYPPVHQFSVYANKRRFSLPRLESLAPRLLTLPLYPGLSEEQVKEIADLLHKTCATM